MYRKEKERERQREREKKGVDTSKDKEEVGALDRGGTAGGEGRDRVRDRDYCRFPD